MTFGHAFEDAPAVWGIGRVVVDGVVTPWPAAQADIDDEAESLAPRLPALGLEPAGVVLIVSLLSQAMHVVPLEKAAGKVGALYSSADATPFDAFRTASLIRQLEAQVVLGVDAEVLDGLDANGTDLAATFGGLAAVATADEDAHAPPACGRARGPALGEARTDERDRGTLTGCATTPSGGRSRPTPVRVSCSSRTWCRASPGATGSAPASGRRSPSPGC